MSNEQWAIHSYFSSKRLQQVNSDQGTILGRPAMVLLTIHTLLHVCFLQVIA